MTKFEIYFFQYAPFSKFFLSYFFFKNEFKISTKTVNFEGCGGFGAPIFRFMKTSVFLTTTQFGFVTVVPDGVLDL